VNTTTTKLDISHFTEEAQAEIRAGRCGWTADLGPTGSQFCGDARADGSPYCSRHLAEVCPSWCINTHDNGDRPHISAFRSVLSPAWGIELGISDHIDYRGERVQTIQLTRPMPPEEADRDETLCAMARSFDLELSPADALTLAAALIDAVRQVGEKNGVAR
jgi:hypothetical protein